MVHDPVDPIGRPSVIVARGRPGLSSQSGGGDGLTRDTQRSQRADEDTRQLLDGPIGLARHDG